jgi:hypothetical protein
MWSCPMKHLNWTRIHRIMSLYCFVAVKGSSSCQLFVLLLRNVFANYSCCFSCFNFFLRIMWQLLISGHICSMNDRETARRLLQSDYSDRFWCFSQSIQACTEIIFQIRPPLLNISFPFKHSRIVLSFDGVWFCYWKLHLGNQEKKSGILLFTTRALYLRILRTVVSDGPPDCCDTAVLVSGRSCKFTRVFLCVPSLSRNLVWKMCMKIQ